MGAGGLGASYPLCPPPMGSVSPAPNSGLPTQPKANPAQGRGPRAGPYGLSFSLKFHPAWALRRGPECASTEQFVFHGALASITPLFLRRFLDHSGRPGTPSSWVWECGAQAGHGSLWCPALCTTLSWCLQLPGTPFIRGSEMTCSKSRGAPGWLM